MPWKQTGTLTGPQCQEDSSSYCSEVQDDGLLPLGTPTLRVIPRVDDGCTFYDISGSFLGMASGAGYQEEWVGLCKEDGTTCSGWILFKECCPGACE